MACPNGCGDLEQFVAISHAPELDAEERALKTSKLVYERCQECGYEETIGFELFDAEG